MESFNQYVVENWMLFALSFGLFWALAEGLKYVMKSIRDAAQLQAENDLKREMIQRGMSADEILRVLHGTSPEAAKAPAKTGMNYLAELGKALAIQEVSASIMEAILTHFATIPEEHQPAIYSSLQEMIDSSVEESSLLAAISSFAKAYASKAKSGDEAASPLATSV